MISDFMMKALLLQYFAITIAYLVEKNWIFSIYWLGASILNLAVLMMSKSILK